MKQLRYIVWLLPLLMQGCDFFYSTVEYKGREAEPRLCVFARNQPSDRFYVELSHSVFFLDADTLSIPWVNDADVTLQVNSMPEVTAEYFPEPVRYFDSIRNTYRHILGHRYSAPIVYGGNDTVRLHVEHPMYGTAEALQVCPMMQQFTITLDSVVNQREFWAHLHLDAYMGASTDVLSMFFDVTGWYDNQYGYVDYLVQTYSKEKAFGELHNQLTYSGYYAGFYMYLPVADTDRDIPVVLAPRYSTRFNDSILQNIERLTISGTIRVHTQDYYQHLMSLARVRGNGNEYVEDFVAPNDSTERRQYYDMVGILDRIAEEFTVLGNAESYQVYGNLSAGNKHDLQPFGCFSLYQETYQQIWLPMAPYVR
ncbi:MAG: hypothetical protein IJT12_04775 [Paludibacteraceae bacterium]|nr:hypothetical protein [Paludibacteraceae bacterium]